MVKPMSTEGMAEATGHDFKWWANKLDKVGARDLPHADIAKLVATLAETSPWWAQGITVAYEQYIGRRKPGQRSDGTYGVSASLTVAGEQAEVLARWQKHAKKSLAKYFKLEGEPTINPQSRYQAWRGKFVDGSIAVIGFTNKPSDKCAVAVDHQKVTAENDLAKIKSQWREILMEALT
jgi:hypothetical protein